MMEEEGKGREGEWIMEEEGKGEEGGGNNGGGGGDDGRVRGREEERMMSPPSPSISISSSSSTSHHSHHPFPLFSPSPLSLFVTIFFLSHVFFLVTIVQHPYFCFAPLHEETDHYLLAFPPYSSSLIFPL